MAADRKQAPPDPRADLMADGAVGVKEAVRFCGLSRSELYRLMDAGRLAFATYGRRRLIPRRALVDLLSGSVVSLGDLPAPELGTPAGA